MKPDNKIVVITGASKGLGREIAFRLSRRNANMILIARTRSLLEQLQYQIREISGLSPLIIPCDISNEADVEHMAATISGRFSHVDVLINNAAIGIHKTSVEISNEEMRRQFEVNFFGSFYCIKALLPLLRLGGSPYILNVNSVVSRLAFADNSVYAATKSALLRFSDGLRQELKASNVRVGSFFPGLMKTSFQSDRKANLPSFITVEPEKAAVKVEKMIIRRKKNAYVSGFLVFVLMKTKQLIG